MSHWPYKATLMYPDEPVQIWWPESSFTSDTMVIGDQIPGDKKTAELCARCCNIAYQQAIEDVVALFKTHDLDASKLVKQLTTKS